MRPYVRVWWTHGAVPLSANSRGIADRRDTEPLLDRVPVDTDRVGLPPRMGPRARLLRVVPVNAARRAAKTVSACRDTLVAKTRCRTRSGGTLLKLVARITDERDRVCRPALARPQGRGSLHGLLHGARATDGCDAAAPPLPGVLAVQALMHSGVDASGTAPRMPLAVGEQPERDRSARCSTSSNTNPHGCPEGGPSSGTYTFMQLPKRVPSGPRASQNRSARRSTPPCRSIWRLARSAACRASEHSRRRSTFSDQTSASKVAAITTGGVTAVSPRRRTAHRERGRAAR